MQGYFPLGDGKDLSGRAPVLTRFLIDLFRIPFLGESWFGEGGRISILGKRLQYFRGRIVELF